MTQDAQRIAPEDCQLSPLFRDQALRQSLTELHASVEKCLGRRLFIDRNRPKIDVLFMFSRPWHHGVYMGGACGEMTSNSRQRAEGQQWRGGFEAREAQGFYHHTRACLHVAGSQIVYV